MRRLSCEQLTIKKVTSCDIQTATLEYEPCACNAGRVIKEDLMVCPECHKVLGERVEVELTKHIANCCDCVSITPDAWDDYFVDTV